MKKICVTGANGFIGNSLCKALVSSGKSIRGFVRTFYPNMNFTLIEQIVVGDICSKTNWKDQLRGYDCIVHCAGRAHLMKEKNDIETYRLVNTEGTKRLAEQAVEAGVKRLVFLSSVKVNGESTGKKDEAKIFTNNDIPNPQDAYSISKFEAENILWKIASKTGLEVVVVRLPLVYGYGARGNLERLMKLINLNIPLPFSLIENQRSLIGIDNLVDVLVSCIEHPKAKGNTFLVSDGQNVSTPNLLKYIASAMGHSALLFPFPISLLKFFSFVLGKSSEIDRLVGSFQIDSSYTKKTLNWSPPLSVYEGIKRMVKG